MFYDIQNHTIFNEKKGLHHKLASTPLKVEFSDIGIFFMMFADGAI